MEILILGGDLRYLEIINRLSVNHSIDAVGFKEAYLDNVNNVTISDVDMSKYDVIIFPINGVNENNQIMCKFGRSVTLEEDLLVGTRDNVLIFSGINTPNLSHMLDVAGRTCTFLMKDNDVVRDNAVLTSEGIIADVIINTEKGLNEENVLVLGYGNIGKVLVRHLSLLGAHVCVGVIDDKDKVMLDEASIDCFFTNDDSTLKKAINSADVIINTVPSKIVDEADYKFINKEAYVLDIASSPYGFDREVLDMFFIKNKLYLGIPGKVAPITAGKILSLKIAEIMGGKSL